MGILTRILRPDTQRANLTYPPAWLLEAVRGGMETATGKTVTPENSLQYTAVLAAVRVLSESVASLPCIVYQRLERGKKRARDHYLYPVLHDAPNPRMTAFEFFELGMVHLALWGNFYAEIERDGAGRARALWPLRPDRVDIVALPDGDLLYRVTLPDSTTADLPSVNVLHVRGMGSDGIRGKSMISLARQAIGLGLAAEEFGARFFANDARPGVVLQHPGVLGETALKHLRESWESRHGGLSGAHRIAILEEGMTVKEIGIPPEDAQFLQTRRFQVNEIARIFRIPPHMLGDLERATFSNIEHQSIEFVVHTLRPWLVRWEQVIRQRLFLPGERRDYFAEFLVDGLLRGDTESRYRAYAIGRQWGWLSADDVREMENMNPLPEGRGQIYMIPMNMMPAPRPGEPQGDSGQTGTGQRAVITAPEVRAAQVRRRLVYRYRSVIENTAQRIVNREVNDIRNAARKYLAQRSEGDFLGWLDQFLEEHKAFVAKYLLPVYLAYAGMVADLVADEVNYQPTEDEVAVYIREYTENSAERWVKHTRGEIDRALREAVEEERDPLSVVEEKLDHMRDVRAGKVAEKESVAVNNATARRIYMAAGIVSLRWVNVGESCPYCQAMHGRKVGIRDLFLAAGDSFHPDGADAPLTPSYPVRYPPLHRGCDCMIVAGV